VCAVTATRDRRSDPAEDAGTAWDDRPIIGTSSGLPWWGAVLLAFGLATVGAVVDMLTQGSLGVIYQGAYILGCVGAVAAVRRRSLFGPMVQPPLVFAVTAIAAIILLDDESGGGGMQQLFSIAIPLTKNFPTMAIATALTVAAGLYRLWKEKDPNPPVRAADPKDRKKNGKNRAEPPEPRRGKDRVPPPSRKPAEPPPEKAKRGRQPRERTPDRSADRRDRTTGDRPTRGSRGRDQQPPRRRDPEDRRPRRDERPAPSRRDRDQGGRGTPRPRRRPPDQDR
jgi:hypothetical protein